jgi:hypothetical protein
MLDEKRHKAKLKFSSSYKVLWIILTSVRIRIRVQSGNWIRIRIQEGKKDPQK